MLNSLNSNINTLDPASLYPEVKGELINFIVEKAGIDEEKLVNPSLGSFFYGAGYLTVNFNSKRKNVEDLDVDTICGDNYFAKVSAGPFTSFTIDYILGSSFMVKYYGFKKMKERFPEFELDEELMIGVPWYDIDFKELLYEDVVIEVNDHYSVVQRIMDLGEIKELNLRYNNRLNQDFSKVYHELNDEDNRLKHIVAIYKKLFDRSSKGYVSFAEKLASSGLCRDKDLLYYTCFPLKFKKGTKEEFLGSFYFRKDKSDLKLIMELKWYDREKAMRLLNL